MAKRKYTKKNVVKEETEIPDVQEKITTKSKKIKKEKDHEKVVSLVEKATQNDFYNIRVKRSFLPYYLVMAFCLGIIFSYGLSNRN